MEGVKALKVNDHGQELTRIERKVLGLRFGRALTIRQIASDLNVPLECVLIAERRALKKISNETGLYFMKG